MPHQLQITNANINDAGLLTELGITIFRDTFSADNRPEDMDKYIAEQMNLQQITAELEDDTNHFFLVYADGVAAGYAKLRTRINPEAPPGTRPIELERLYVLQAYHGHKIGAALMAHCLSFGRQHGCDIIWLGVWEHNHRAVEFYKKWGFEPFGSHIFQLGDDPQTDMLMKLPL